MDPRKARSRELVLEAGIALLAEGGIRAFTVDAVAARSGVAKTTIYRQWPTRGDLLSDVYGSLESHTATPDTGSLRGDIEHLMRDLAHELATADWARNLTAVVAEGEHDPDLAAGHRAHAHVESAPLREVLQRAKDRGELAVDADVQLATELVAGALFYRRLVLHSTTTRREVDHLVDLLLAGLSTGAHPVTPPTSKDGPATATSTSRRAARHATPRHHRSRSKGQP